MEEEAIREGAASFGRLQFHKAFNENIYRLIQLETLWEKRKKPTQLRFDELSNQKQHPEQQQEQQGAPLLADQRVASSAELTRLFVESSNRLLARKQDLGSLEWDKDDADALDFVTAAANLRSLCYGIEQLSRFDVKQKAGNIIAAIATTNAIVAGLIVLEALKIINGEFDACRFTYLYKEPNSAGRLLSSVKLEDKSPACFVCSQSFVDLQVTESFTLGDLVKEVLGGHFGMTSPNIMAGDSLLYESPLDGEEDEMAGQLRKTFSDVHLQTGSAIEATDNLAAFTLSLSIKIVPRLTKIVEEKETEIKWRVGGAEPEQQKQQPVAANVADVADVEAGEPKEKKIKI